MLRGMNEREMISARSSAYRPGRVIDAHTHAFPDQLAPKAMARLTEEALWFEIKAHYDGTAGGLLASMDRAGIERSIVCSIATRPEQVEKITEWSAGVARAYDGRLIPFVSIHPDYAEVEAELERARNLGLRGVKFHPYYMNCAADDPRSLRIARTAEALGMAMEIHAGYDLAFERNDLASPAAIRRLHEAAPTLRLVAAHLGGWERWDEVLAELVGLPIYFETSYSLSRINRGKLERVLEGHDGRYLLFGSDGPWNDQAAALEEVLALKLPAELERGMLWENAVRLVGE